MNGKIVGIGELLWDVFPDGRYPGGAPFNFAWHARMLGAEAAIIGEVTPDRPGTVTARTALGAWRFVDLPMGELLPRIC